MFHHHHRRHHHQPHSHQHRSRTRFAGTSLTAVAALAIGALGLVGCGGGDDAPAAAGTAEVRIVSDDQMRFDVDRFTVQAGQDVRLTLDHVGQMSVEHMGHNVAILNSDEDPVDFGNEVGREGGSLENEYLPESMRDRVIAYTRMIGGGESDTIEFTAPDEPGEYPFVCTFPGHFSIMRGVMVVQQ